MDYQKIYNELCTRAKNRNLTGYTETHHIIPKCLGGSNDKDNLVVLTAREHFIAHKILSKIYPDHYGLAHALYMMGHMSNQHQERYITSARDYERIKSNAIILMKEHWKKNPRKNGMAGRTHSTETKELISNLRKRYPSSGMKGKKHTEESKRKMSKSKIGKSWGNHTEETKDKISKAQKGRTNYWQKGLRRPHTEETKQKLSEMRKDTQHRGDNHAAKKIKDIDTAVIYNCKLDAIEQLDLSYYQINKKIKLGKFKEL